MMNSWLEFFLTNLIFVALLAVFEIVIEREKGWGSGFKKNTWYDKPFLKHAVFLRKLTHTKPLLVYHAVVFGIIYPAFLIILAGILNVSNTFFLFAVYVISLSIEDFFWFLLNPYFHSLKELFKGPHGKIWWHEKWTKIFKIYIPFSYITSFCLSVTFFIIAIVVS